MSKTRNSRIKTKGIGKHLGTTMPLFITKGESKKGKKKRETKIKRERIQKVNNKITNFNQGGQR